MAHKNRVRLELLLTPLHTIIVCPKCTECLSAACYCANCAWRRFRIPARVVIGEISILEMTARSPGPTLCWLVSHALMHVLERTPGRKHAPDAHAHFSSTDVGTLCADLLVRRVLRCRPAASFGSLTWNLSRFSTKKPQLKYLGNLRLPVIVQPTVLLASVTTVNLFINIGMMGLYLVSYSVFFQSIN